MPQSTKTATKTCRLLYYGPAGAGKRENLSLIHRTIPPEARLQVAVEDPERQIAFQFRRPGEEPWQVLVLMQLSYILMGTFLDDTAMLIIVAPLYVPLVSGNMAAANAFLKTLEELSQ
mgnify:CR=1 FL=1